MQKIVINLLILLAVMFVIAMAASGASAAAPVANGPLAAEPPTGPFDGIFYGYIHSDNGSKAPMILDLTHQADRVAGDIYLGEGLFVDAGICGSGHLPAGQQYASGRTRPGNPNQLQAGTRVQVQGFEIGVELTGQVSASGETLDAQAKVDLPWFCGSDPTISGSLLRYHPPS